MNIDLLEITVRELIADYEDSEENGVFGYGGKLDIRPPFQREFVYSEKQQDEVIKTVINGFPLNIMYWSVRADGGYEILDGQQRTVSICRFVASVFSINIDGKANLYFTNLSHKRKEQILDYQLTVYVCDGDNDEKIKWFEVINIAGESLTNQELLNAIYAGSWASDAKRYFSKNKAGAEIGKKYIKGNPDRQEYLERAIQWIIKSTGDNDVSMYMGKHQHDQDAKALWEYFQKVINWVKGTFTYKDNLSNMKGRAWGRLYHTHKDDDLDIPKIKKQTEELLTDYEVKEKGGIYEYILTKDQRHLTIRSFEDSIKIPKYMEQEGKCAHCKNEFKIKEMHADHIKPWSKGGKTISDNCQMLCAKCNQTKSSRY